MAQTLTPIATLLDRGVGIPSLQAVAVAATDVNLQFANDGDMILFVDNQNAGARVATLKATPDSFGRGGGGDNDESISIPTGELGFFPFMSPAMFNDVGVATVILDAVTDASAALYRLVKRG